MQENFTLVYQGELRNVATHLASGYTIETDAPVDNHGKGSRFSPTDLLCVSLASCMMTIMGIKAKQENLALEHTRVAIQKKMQDAPRRVSGIVISFSFDSALGLNEKQKLLLQRAANTCPVKYSIHPDIEVDVRWNW